MSESTLYTIGHFSKLHGFKGELTAYIENGDPAEYEGLKKFVVETLDGDKIFKVLIIQKKTNNTLKVKLEGIFSEEDARRFLKNAIKVPREELSESDEIKIAVRELAGFKVMDEKVGEAGIVKAVMELPNNPLLEIELKGKTYLLPIHEDILLNIDQASRTIHIAAPDGLFNINDPEPRED
ncbi:MAG: ribosome maturation factor RimM [Flavobacteriales bacterium]|nr:ribosome maturation factor RimM [Flavobacteriales bacterium]